MTFIQRFDSALRLNVHFHSLFLDGVFVHGDDGELDFHELDEPSAEQVAEVAERTARRVIKLLGKAGRSLDREFHDDEMDDFVQRQPALASLYAAAARGVDLSGDRAGQPTMRLFQQDSLAKKEPHAVVGGINLHAAVAFDARDKPRMVLSTSSTGGMGAARADAPFLLTGSSRTSWVALDLVREWAEVRLEALSSRTLRHRRCLHVRSSVRGQSALPAETLHR